MKLTYKKAFTLIEMAIVLVILAVIVGSFSSLLKEIYIKEKIITSSQNIDKIKHSIIGYAMINNRLPYQATDDTGVENAVAPLVLGNLPFITLQVPSKDEFGIAYMYDVNTNLTTTLNKAAFCTALDNVILNTELPQVQNTASTVTTPIAAIVISKGADKILTGKNATPPVDRIYEMASNSYSSTNDDLVIEITATELKSKLSCP